MTKEEKLLLINEIFTPAAPIDRKELFCGRINEISEIERAIIEKGQHIVMFGPRGAGKSSLANMCRFLFDDLMTIKINCTRNDSFKSIWERALRKIRFLNQASEVGFKAKEKIEAVPIYVPEIENLSATEIEHILTELNQTVLFIFDEFDTIKSLQIKSQMADMIKMLSDNLPNISLLIVGIAQNVENLLGEHQSIERCIKQIELPLMNDTEAHELIKDNLRMVGLEIRDDIAAKIIDLASGFPNYMHLLCKYAAEDALNNNSSSVLIENFNVAVIKSIENSDYSVRNAYQKAVGSTSGKSQFPEVLLACACAITDFENSFGSYEVLEQYNKITGSEHKPESINYNLGMLCKRERAEILTKLGRQKNARYRFRKPLLKAFVKLKQHEMKIV